MTLKKIGCGLFTVLLLFALALVGCGQQTAGQPSQTDEAVQNAQKTPAPGEGETDAAAEATKDAATEPETEGEGAVDPMVHFPAADMSGYAGLREYDKDLAFVDVTVRDIAALMEEKADFAFLASFPTCPWCNVVIDELNDAALEAGVRVGNLNTRKDPSWKSNLDIEDYDLFTTLFQKQLEYDKEGRLHLYVPHFFVVRGGEVVYQHQGALREMGDDPNTPLSPEQEKLLVDLYREGLQKMTSKDGANGQ